MVAWIKRFIECWKLARRIQRGELLAITSGHVAERYAAQVPTPPPPVSVLEPDDDSQGQWCVMSHRGEIAKTLCQTNDASYAKRVYFRPVTSGVTVRLINTVDGSTRLERTV